MPPKVRELIAKLEKAGFTHRGGKGNHRNYVHPKVTKPISVAGKPGDDVVKAVRKAIAESKINHYGLKVHSLED